MSRCGRELDGRLLSVTDIWKIKTLMHQVSTRHKRKQVGTDLFTMEEEQSVAVSRTTAHYLEQLHTYLLAIAIAGSSKPTTMPTEVEAFGSDQTKYCCAPWDVLEGYYFRAMRAAQCIPEQFRLSWLERTDVAERAHWVSQFREGTDTIGHVIATVMERRSAHWDVPMFGAPSFSGRGQDRGPPGNFNSPERPNKAPRTDTPKRANDRVWSPAPPGRELQQGEVATHLKDGKALCPDFQRGKCNQKTHCSKGLHRCGNVTSKGRICGINYHCAKDCRQK